MPFGLKNTREIYQRFVNKIFKNQIGCGLEVYVDDILVKNESMGEHVRSLSETFVALRAHSMKLNPEKCALGVSRQVPRLNDFERGIEVNLKKIQAIMEMSPL